MKLEWMRVRDDLYYLWMEEHPYYGGNKAIAATVSENRVHFGNQLAGSPGDKTRFSSMEEAMKYAETVVRMEYT